MGKQLLAKTKTKRERCQLQNLPRRYWISYIVYHSNGIKFWVLFSVVFLTTIWSYIKYIPKRNLFFWGGFSLTLIIIFLTFYQKDSYSHSLHPYLESSRGAWLNKSRDVSLFMSFYESKKKNITLRCENYLWRLTTLRYHSNCYKNFLL